MHETSVPSSHRQLAWDTTYTPSISTRAIPFIPTHPTAVCWSIYTRVIPIIALCLSAQVLHSRATGTDVYLRDYYHLHHSCISKKHSFYCQAYTHRSQLGSRGSRVYLCLVTCRKGASRPDASVARHSKWQWRHSVTPCKAPAVVVCTVSISIALIRHPKRPDHISRRKIPNTHGESVRTS